MRKCYNCKWQNQNYCEWTIYHKCPVILVMSAAEKIIDKPEQAERCACYSEVKRRKP